ncbi:hypothetical protein CLAFUW4_05999 [Fulvia fulva]|uniref:Glycosyl transferase CAP10 domain-containing protein n=1 Tax=Passalora fulva TaxID=5499 RepID=A0A9Q8P9L1_PASFU|nr:uncharacterized protein CLAFUR5_06143 [Fulvia fulva]KAK4624404.1 hypothetical protein CLAFUR4_06004 [Fulvia fulva]KAK4624854.1 hypothetical protein CLAFUR0_06007 [Fulvia fulva]UJO18405.1 hypothetical protein CLAFUR5_06143 [Fulvia fulva]WPV14576.1 hypothetical protein CLAFUW4_05999 [Fulvia fulva]WPV29858.1 hypothetical protein CLAFUW7_05997 [Fulvia fulva]
MRAIALYSTLFVLIAGALVIVAIHGGTNYAREFVDGYEHSIVRPSKEQQEHEPAAHTTGWTFSHRTQGRNYGLTEEQCNVAFPHLYREIDRAVQHRKDKWGNITPDELETAWRGDGIVRAQIHDNQLYIIDAHGVVDHNHRPRTVATLHSLHRAISAFQGKLPDIEFTFTVHDAALPDSNGNETTWAYTRREHQEKLWLMPDFGLWGWPDVGLRSFAELQEVLEHEEDEFVDKEPKLVWRGSVAVGSKDVRHGLVDHSKGKSWSDVQTLDWANSTNIQERLLSMQDHCSYMFVAQTEGNTYSGRLKYLLNCHSVLFSHDLEWLELYHHLMKKSGPDQNYIRVKRDFSDLASTMDRFSRPANYLQAQKIADNARRTFRERYLTPAAEACYWRAMIRGWSEVQDFQPEFWEEVTEYDKVKKKEVQKRKPRGAPFESYAIMEEVDWQLPAKARKMCIDE